MPVVSGVDFIVNCYERTYREVLAPAFMASLAKQQSFDFAEVTVLINNVDDMAAAKQAAQQLVDAGEITRFAVVADHLTDALRATGLRPQHIRRLPHFSDCCLVAVTLDGPDWIVYWDADARLSEPADWITPTLAYMQQNPRVAIGNPNTWQPGLTEREALTIERPFAIGYGFSDIAFLARRSELAAPIYRKVAPAAWRFPLAHIEPVFEQRVDAWMRRSGRLRATYLDATFEHVAPFGSNYPDGHLRGRLRGRIFREVGRIAARAEHPALRAWPEETP